MCLLIPVSVGRRAVEDEFELACGLLEELPNLREKSHFLFFSYASIWESNSPTIKDTERRGFPPPHPPIRYKQTDTILQKENKETMTMQH